MALDKFLLEVLEDPIDHGPLLYFVDRELLYNPRRRVAYAVRGSIPVMLPDEARSVAEKEHNELEGDATAISTGTRN